MLPPIGLRTTVPQNPSDRYTGFSWYWLCWFVLGFGIPEYLAIRTENRNARNGTRDRAKRTLSANSRAVAATDSVTGIPLDVPYGKLRRLGLAALLLWLTRHLAREGEM
jgi:hypothetical protein